MRIQPEQLTTALKKSLAPVYLVCGDEPLQVGEAADEIRACSRNAGYSVREVLVAEGNFDWRQLALEADSLSIFSEKKIIDLRIPSGKPGAEGAKALIEYCKHIPEETILIISSSKLAAQAQKSRWFQDIDKVGAVIQVWPLQGSELLKWLQRRSRKKGMQIEQDGLKALASRIEGNLLAASQEIEKLFILHGSGPISQQAVEEMVADSARFDVFILLDSLLSGRINRAIKILRGLQAEGIVEPVVLWALSREARQVFQIKKEIEQGLRKETVLAKYKVWDKRKPLVEKALNRLGLTDLQNILLLCAKADRQIKGQLSGNSWETLFEICLGFCAMPLMAEIA